MTQPTKAIDEMEAAARQHAQSLITPISLTASPEYSFIAGWQKCSEAKDKRVEGLVRSLKNCIAAWGRSRLDVLREAKEALKEFGGES